MIHVVIADDERPARARLRQIIEGLPGGASVTECTDGADAVAAIQRATPDLALLDIRMPELDGIEVVRAVGPDAMPPTVFVTAHDAYAIDAFEVRAVDYVLKPFDEDRVRAAVARALAARAPPATRRAGLAALLAARGARPPISRIAVRQEGRFVVVLVSDVAWLEADDNYVRLHVAGGGAVLLVRGKLVAFAARLDPATFVRVHRSAVVNLAHVREIVSWFHGDQQLLLSTGERIPVSRTHRASLLDRLGVPDEAPRPPRGRPGERG